MEPVTLGILGGLGASYLANFTTPAIQSFFGKVFQIKPELEDSFKKASTPQDIEQIFRDAVGVIDAAAGQGQLDIDGAILEAIRGIRFDHQNGTVNILGTTMKADVLVTGGSFGSTGETTIQQTEMKSKGTQITVSGNAQIKISGNASIKQS